MSEKEGKKQVIKISVFITSIFVIVLSISYAFINQTLIGTKRQVISAGNLELELKEGDAITLENVLPMYDEVGMMQKSYGFTLTNKTTQDTDYTLRLKDVTGEDKEKLDVTLVRYGLTKDGIVTKDLLSNLTDNVVDAGTLAGNQMIAYNLRLWIDSSVEDETQIKDKSLSYQIEVELNQKIAISYPKTAHEIVEKNLGENCKTYDDGVDTFLVGRCSNNYVWYSGKLWRVVLKNNETGAVKMITDNAITAIPYNEHNNALFENSYMDQWLSQEFLPTLHDYQDYLVSNSTWDATVDSSSKPSRPVGTTTVTRTVGLLNAYEYYTTYNKSDGLAKYGTGYLNNGTWWQLMTPYSTSFVRVVYYTGSLTYGGTTGGDGTRPSVNLQAGIYITSGDGTKSNPYRLKGDSGEIVNGETLLSTRYSGEYVTFNNELYRIVGVENGKAKIIAVGIPAALSNNKFHSDDSVISFANASIKTDLENYYQNSVVEPYKSMIEPNTTWYLGTVGKQTDHYKASICKTVDAEISTNTCEKTDITATASIGLPRIGEMFTSQITRGTKVEFWTLTPHNTLRVRTVNNVSYLNYYVPTDSFGVRPSMYLKSTIVIASTNEGDGTYEHPYDIELSK